MTTVMNLSNGSKQEYTCSPTDAVVAAHAQSLGDWNTWDYATKYSFMLETGPDTVLCGNFSAFIDGRQF